jgi:hypothetical protein
MLFGVLSLNRFARSYAVLVFTLALSGGASAVGLGELRGQPVLGQPMQLEIDLLGAEKQKIEAACFRLVRPAESEDIPWLKKASLSVRQGAQPVLEIRSDAPLREPILQLAIQLGCGHEISRDYILMATPPEGAPSPVIAPRLPEVAMPEARQQVRLPVRARAAAAVAVDSPPRLPVRRSERRQPPSASQDRLMLSDSGADAEPSLRLATDIFLGRAETREAQREMLRLEFRMLMALHEQATSQLATAEKLRNMEGSLGELQLRAAEFAKRVESNGAAPASDTASPVGGEPTRPASAAVATPSPELEPVARVQRPPVEAASGLSEWTLYGVLLGAILGVAGWLGWRQYSAGKPGVGVAEPQILVPALTVDPWRDEEHEERGKVDLSFDPGAENMPMQVDFDLHSAGEHSHSPSEAPAQARGQDSVLSISATTLNEQFEANPVMELADIMLSFGRVKGAAQALQEYIDQSPQEALQPWIRLMDIYRMAGMRAEFESVARNLNQNFNVEIQSWDEAQLANGLSTLEEGASPASRANSLEELPRLINTVVTLWNTGDVVGYIYQLLRDNRGGQRLGFTLPVVQDLLFLIELKETANRMEISDE